MLECSKKGLSVEKRREEKGTGGGKGEWGKVSEQAALYAPRILKPIIWLNSFCNYPKGSALHTPNVVQTKRAEGTGGKVEVAVDMDVDMDVEVEEAAAAEG